MNRDIGQGGTMSGQVCPRCGGEGYVNVTCPSCGGDGLRYSGGRPRYGHRCIHCDGQGSWSEKCPECRGKGAI
jgi:molecular chaperone DnaJ